jgi:hypothetical protein
VRGKTDADELALTVAADNQLSADAEVGPEVADSHFAADGALPLKLAAHCVSHT